MSSLIYQTCDRQHCTFLLGFISLLVFIATKRVLSGIKLAFFATGKRTREFLCQQDLMKSPVEPNLHHAHKCGTLCRAHSTCRLPFAPIRRYPDSLSNDGCPAETRFAGIRSPIDVTPNGDTTK